MWMLFQSQPLLWNLARCWPGLEILQLKCQKGFWTKIPRKMGFTWNIFQAWFIKTALITIQILVLTMIICYTFQFILFWTLHVTYFILAWYVFDEIIESLDILVITISDMVLARCDSFHWWSTKLTWHTKPLLHHKNANTKIQKFICILFRVWLFG